jgi:hypothetical protein
VCGTTEATNWAAVILGSINIVRKILLWSRKLNLEGFPERGAEIQEAWCKAFLTIVRQVHFGRFSLSEISFQECP